MRNEPLNAYSLHQRPYQEKRSIYYMLTKEHGILHGIAKKGIPQFVPLMLFATGKKSLKTLQQVNIVEAVPSLMGQQQYAALYLNEITLKLLPVEDSMPVVYEQYSRTIRQLHQPLSLDQLKLVLRIYEQVLFSELGFAIDFEQDSEQAVIDKNQWYYFAPDRGWVRQSMNKAALDAQDAMIQDSTIQDARIQEKGAFNGSDVETTDTVDTTQSEQDSEPSLYQRNPSAFMQQSPISGETIIAMQSGISPQTINSWTDIHRQLIDHLFDYQPLQSRILWQQFYRYQ